MFDKIKKAGSLLGEAVSDGYSDSKNAAMGAIEGAKITVTGRKVISGGVKDIMISRRNLEAVLNGDTIRIDDSETDDGYDLIKIGMKNE